MEQNRPKKGAVTAMQRNFLKAYSAIENRFNLTAACVEAKVGRTTVYRWLAEDSSFKYAFEECRESRLDSIEAALYGRAVEERDTTALIFLAKTLCKNRGYIENSRLSTPEKSPVLSEVIEGLLSGTITIDHGALVLAKEGIPLPEAMRIMLTRLEPKEDEVSAEGASPEELDRRWQEAMANIQRQREEFLPERQAEVVEIKESLKGMSSFDPEIRKEKA